MICFTWSIDLNLEMKDSNNLYLSMRLTKFDFDSNLFIRFQSLRSDIFKMSFQAISLHCNRHFILWLFLEIILVEPINKCSIFLRRIQVNGITAYQVIILHLSQSFYSLAFSDKLPGASFRELTLTNQNASPVV